MPRPKLSRAQKNICIAGLRLPRKAADELLSMLHVDAHSPDRPEIVTRMQNALGVAAEGREHLDHPPRPVHFLKVFAEIEKRAACLVQFLMHDPNCTDYHLDELKASGVDLPALETLLEDLEAACIVLREEFGVKLTLPPGRSWDSDVLMIRTSGTKAGENRGRTSSVALCESVHMLQDVFRDHYNGPRSVRRKRGAVTASRPEDRQEVAFILAACHAGKMAVSAILRNPKSLHPLVFPLPSAQSVPWPSSTQVVRRYMRVARRPPDAIPRIQFISAFSS